MYKRNSRSSVQDLERYKEVMLTKGRNRSGPVLGCEQFHSRNFTWPPGLRTIAVVGNGPLAPASHTEINVRPLWRSD